MNYWCKGLHLRCFGESWKHHYSLSLFLLYQMKVICYSYHLWLLVITKSGKKERKIISLADWKLNYFSSQISNMPPNFQKFWSSFTLFTVSLENCLFIASLECYTEILGQSILCLYKMVNDVFIVSIHLQNNKGY